MTDEKKEMQKIKELIIKMLKSIKNESDVKNIYQIVQHYYLKE